MTETLLTGIKAAIMAAIMQTFGLYAGAFLIALIAALARLAYTAEQPSFNLFGRFFTMSLALTMLMVHVGQLQNWETQLTIVVSGVAAFLCREIFQVVMDSKDSIIRRLLGVKK